MAWIDKPNDIIIIQTVLSLRKKINDIGVAGQLIQFVHPLLITEKDYLEVDENKFKEEQFLMCRVLNLMYNDDSTQYWNILKLFLDEFEQGELMRQQHTYPAMFFALARLLSHIYEHEQQTEQLDY